MIFLMIVNEYEQNGMYIFLDESGNLGFNFLKPNVSRYFIITLLCCDNEKVASFIRLCVKRTIKNKINSKKSKPKMASELKGYLTPPPVQHYLYSRLNKFTGWEINTLIIDKHNFTLPKYVKYHSLYNFFVGYILDKYIVQKKISSLVLTVDKCKTAKEMAIFNQHIAGIVYHHLQNPKKMLIDHEESHADKAIQAVDAFCYSIYKKYEHQDTGLYNLFANRVNLELNL